MLITSSPSQPIRLQPSYSIILNQACLFHQTSKQKEKAKEGSIGLPIQAQVYFFQLGLRQLRKNTFKET